MPRLSQSPVCCTMLAQQLTCGSSPQYSAQQTVSRVPKSTHPHRDRSSASTGLALCARYLVCPNLWPWAVKARTEAGNQDTQWWKVVVREVARRGVILGIEEGATM